jgi:hypothetical protein
LYKRQEFLNRYPSRRVYVDRPSALPYSADKYESTNAYSDQNSYERPVSNSYDDDDFSGSTYEATTGSANKRYETVDSYGANDAYGDGYQEKPYANDQESDDGYGSQGDAYTYKKPNVPSSYKVRP